MAFSSLLFLTLFLPVYVVAYWASPRVTRNATLLTLSILFYAWGAPWFLPVVLALGVIDYYLALAIDKRRGQRAARLLLAFAVTMHLSVLAYFKYSNFFVGEIGSLFAKLGVARSLHWENVALPIGISFLTFEEISYVVDVYRGSARPSRSIGQYLLFLMLFPHSIAGPIFRWKDLENQLRSRGEGLDDIVAGLSRFTWGLSKKILIADAAALAADAAFAHSPSEVSMRVAWLGAVAYAIQIFYDFSGYSDMAIGLGRIAGFRFKENFNDPYVSANITEFWTRWHISLSSWLRDYLYIPLGGNRRGEFRTRVNVLIVFALSGLWHGSAWTFVLWGLYHGLLSVFERTAVGKLWRERTPRLIAVPVTFVLVSIGWVFFRADSAEQALSFIKAMLGLVQAPPVAKMVEAQLMPLRSAVLMCVGLALVVVRAVFGRPREDGPWRWVYVAGAPVLLVLSLLQVVNTKFVPLIYFKF
ncbi:MAG TPA: MBOAT family O-acyltransferase [Labilithrix sp.]|nr:MBOAT family O-acyltransferase [Labilithrix sp.]